MNGLIGRIGWVLLLLLSVGLSSGCAYIEKGAYKSVDAGVAYCEANTPSGRKVVRDTLRKPAEEKDIAIGLRCPGDDKMYVVGDPKQVVTDD